jgi:hypothetical protein
MPMTTVINRGLDLGKYLDTVIKESLKSTLQQKTLDEKEKQLKLGGGDDNGGDSTKKADPHNRDGKTSDFDSMKDDDKSKTMSADTDNNDGSEIKLDDIVDKLNTIRSGKSFKDSAVQSHFQEYFQSLKEPERVAMLAFLKGIAQIVTGEVGATQADDPSKADVSMHQGPHTKEKHVKPEIIKKPIPPGDETPKPQKGAEDTSSPISVKKRNK